MYNEKSVKYYKVQVAIMYNLHVDITLHRENHID